MSFYCPITQDVMVNPVLLVETGHPYERAEIVRLFETIKTDPDTVVCFQTDPNTGVCLQSTPLVVPNHGLRCSIQEFIE